MSARITKIRVRGLKGADVTYQLGAVVLFLGVNGSGKSTVQDALRLLLRGEHPTAGRGGTPAKRNDDVLALASGDEIEIRGWLDNDAGTWEIGRSWSRHTVTRGASSGTVRTTSDVWVITPQGKRQEKRQAEATIADLVGPAAGLDLAELLGPSVTDTGRRKLLLGAAGALSAWSPERVAAELAERSLDLGPWVPPPQGQLLVDWLQDAHATAAAHTSRAHAELLRSRGAAEKLEARLVEREETVRPEEVTALRAQVKASEERAQGVAQKTDRAEQKARGDVERAEAADAKRRRLEQQLATCRQQIADLEQDVGLSPRVAELRGLIEDAEDEMTEGGLAELRFTLEQEVQAEAHAKAMAEACEEDRRTAHRETQEAIATGKAMADRLTNDAEAACSEPMAAYMAAMREAQPALALAKALALIVEKADANLEEPTCPTCMQEIDPDSVDRIEAASKSAREAIVQCGATLDKALDAARGKLQAKIEEQRGVVRALQAEEAEAKEAHTTAEADLAKTKANTSEARWALEKMEKEVESWRRELAAAEATDADSEAATLAERQRQLETDLRGCHVPSLQALREVLEQQTTQGGRERRQAADELAGLREQLAPLEDSLAIHREALGLRQEVQAQEKAWRECQRVEDALGPDGLLGVILAEILSPLEGLVNSGLEGLGLGVFRVRLQDERGAPVCRPGLERGEVFVPVETLSDGEQASVLPVLLPALATLVEGPYRVLLADALERLDSGRREAFLRRVVGLVEAGRIDQAVLAGCPDVAPEVEGCTVIEVGGER